jgi:hypothetical protein
MFPNGDREAHRIGLEDWPILLQLERTGKLTHRDETSASGSRG